MYTHRILEQVPQLNYNALGWLSAFPQVQVDYALLFQQTSTDNLIWWDVQSL